MTKRWRPCTKVWKTGTQCTGVPVSARLRGMRWRPTGHLNIVGNPRFEPVPYQTISAGDGIRQRAHDRPCS